MSDGKLMSALDLSQSGRIVIREQRVIVPGDVSFQPGGLVLPDCRSHLRVIDLPSEVAWLVPMTPQMEAGLLGQLNKLALLDVGAKQH